MFIFLWVVVGALVGLLAAAPYMPARMVRASAAWCGFTWAAVGALALIYTR